MKQKFSGFTIIELLVVMFIVAMIATISIANFRKGQKQKELAQAADTVISGIRNAQNFTLTSKQIAASACGQGKAAQSYIVIFTASQTIELYGIDKCGVSNFLERYGYTPNIRVQANGYKIDGISTASLQLKFIPPFGAVTASTSSSVGSGPFSNFTRSTISIEILDGSAAKTVTVDGVAGRIGE
ncbi:MAG: hypothetical protein A3J07_05020 [Candidatus Doudnabacteria bacterium RIFCSPLOWO2_02_FULL_49_13]|uniref:General secretion pathway GspH domain-containing protein n=1 Tax=Candidatus Doudnabacteria bacterium RIFCSPHIGHO2_12_FULL_48_16 TaxID=1817838 RepID=A0A1F5PKU4_9BACT|nr:MAG: hypothetical protein A3B77_04660 [Candidatus Doudnabacteria bacterium RIFCSPHIGHO2_02_FULL_49_24]OGE88180.1 MAG: hypothetical protein A2760_02310 [Candidatus Doudnabacteria bacterium RIFCSPHIGHO2_01_FULL_50_67]OGE90489.1 MAG: hypothetical protein A3E29_05090 [Candidatus Doudnabacteria bacterium RIFCSPHIGHO2_12_FULL_48_16]OGE96551.1 MAG: hypothetical protein A2990_03535 [Candidatus Doudnabacteria bacterium RIFCSPLOWO2_01_FULL_49_40]OGF02677.1 MAG: hypothetical protein A3H14_03380 [Candid